MMWATCPLFLTSKAIVMKQFKISGKDVAELSSHLESLSSKLPETQQALLKAIVSFSKDGLSAATGNFGDRLTEKNLNYSGFDLSVPENVDVKKILDEAFDMKAKVPIDPVSPIADSIGVGVTCVSWSKDYNKIAALDNSDLLNDVKIQNILTEIRNIKGINR